MKVIEKNNKPFLTKDEFEKRFVPKWSNSDVSIIYDIRIYKTNDINKAYDIYCGDTYVVIEYGENESVVIKNSFGGVFDISEDVGAAYSLFGGDKCTGIRFITAEEFNNESKRNNT